MHPPNAAVCAGCQAGAVPARRLSDLAGVRSRRRVAGADDLQSRITQFLDVDNTDQAAPVHCSSPRSLAVTPAKGIARTCERDRTIASLCRSKHFDTGAVARYR
jgi:hypothetical protein